MRPTPLMLLALVALAAPGCSKSSNSANAATVQFQQIERLGRPAINEGLVVSNGLLNAFNAIPPSADFSAAAAPVRAEVLTVLDAVDAADGNDDSVALDIALAFLPDVMRIDTALSVAIADPAYTAAFANIGGNNAATPVSGRKLEDDVIDVTLQVVVGSALPDNVGYEGVVGNAGQPGHKRLEGQSVARGSAVFPFLANPN